MIFGGYKASKLKPQLKMAVTRFQIAANKKSALMKQQIREIAKMLAEDPPKEEKARIKSEALIRDDNTVEVSFCPSYIMFMSNNIIIIWYPYPIIILHAFIHGVMANNK